MQHLISLRLCQCTTPAPPLREDLIVYAESQTVVHSPRAALIACVSDMVVGY